MSRTESGHHVIVAEVVWGHILILGQTEQSQPLTNELEWYIAEHPEECHQLKYGETCWFDGKWREYDNEVLPTEPGRYAAWVWTEGPDWAGEYEGGLDWSPLEAEVKA